LIFENLVINRVVVHEVFQRGDDRSLQAPALAVELENLDADAMAALKLRSTDALSAKSIQMRIAKYGADSFLAAAETMVGADDGAFLAGSQMLATKLSEAQLHRSIPGGMLTVFDGTVGAAATPFLCVIKAETQSGFNRTRHRGRNVVEFMKNLFLTPAVRLYKLGIVLQDDGKAERPDGWRAFVYDSNISPGNREAAALYFYDGFLGCELPSDAPYETAKFFDLTKTFVRESDLDGDKKRDLIDSLHVFVRDDQTPTFTASEFAERYMPPDLRDDFSQYMERKRFTPNAVVRDISEMGKRLERRRFKFGSDIELSASPEALKQKITMETIDGAPVDGATPKWTRITIRQALTGER
jgi:hypothetical protein